MLKTAQEVASNFFDPPQDESGPTPDPVRTVTLRVGSSLVSLVDVFAKHADMSRSAFLVDLIEVGLNSVRAHLPQEMQDQFFDEHLGDLASEGSR